ncbi:protein disulfide oxidoreductase [Methylomagnum sp.]
MTPRLKHNLLTWTALLALFVGLQFFVNRNLATGIPPPIHGPMLDGREFAGIDSLPKPAVIYFWASWCGVCESMQGTVRGLAADTPILTVALQSGDGLEVGAYMKKQGFEVPAVLDPDGTIGKSYGVRGVPTLFIVGRDGTVKSSTAGYTSELGVRARLWLAGFWGALDE